jgi:hypothetical protein
MQYDGQATCLDLIERQFVELTTPPNPLALDGAALGCGLPARTEPLDKFRVLLLKRQTTWVTKDAVWKELVKRAHNQPKPWTIAAAGMMIPGLKQIAGKLNARYPGEKSDLDSEILNGFLEALDLAEPGHPKVYGQLYWSAFRRGHEACSRENRILRQNALLDDATCASYRRPVSGHPDLILAGAVLDHALTEEQAALLSDVRLDGERQESAADRRGLSKHGCRALLAQAERKLVEFLHDRIPDTAA